MKIITEQIALLRKFSYFCNARIRHASRRTAYQGGTFCLYRLMIYTNPPLSTTTLITNLKTDGLSVNDENFAEDFLNNVSYFRFNAYLRPFEDVNGSIRFKPNATFDKAVALYRFDAELRNLLFSAIQLVKISLRSKIINQFSLAHGAFWFIDPTMAINKHKYSENLSTLERELSRSKDDFIQEHYDKYGREDFPPAWKLLDLTSFGTLTKLYFNFADRRVKKAIARSYGVPQHEILESWMKAVNTLRNSCAHHNRVWNRIMPVMPQIPLTLRNAWISSRPSNSNRLYAVLCCLIYWLNSFHPSNSLVDDFKKLLTKYPNTDVAAMGFPNNWETEPLWQ